VPIDVEPIAFLVPDGSSVWRNRDGSRLLAIPAANGRAGRFLTARELVLYALDRHRKKGPRYAITIALPALLASQTESEHHEPLEDQS
jgi:hypothetical protein